MAVIYFDMIKFESGLMLKDHVLDISNRDDNKFLMIRKDGHKVCRHFLELYIKPVMLLMIKPSFRSNTNVIGLCISQWSATWIDAFLGINFYYK